MLPPRVDTEYFLYNKNLACPGVCHEWGIMLGSARIGDFRETVA
jgi:hypothetical protein